MIRAALLAALLLLPCAVAQARDCDRLFLAGRAPEVAGAHGPVTALCFRAYAVTVSGSARDPLWSAEHLTARYAARAPRTPRDGIFHAESLLPPDSRADPQDYGHGWDKGHMTPAGDVASRRAKGETFSMANVVPQTPALNRGIWEGIESAVRDLAVRDGDVYIVTGPVLQSGDSRTADSRVEIPTATWKAIYAPSTGRSGAWICSNTVSPDCRTVSIAALSRAVGVNPFPALRADQAGAAPNLPAPEPSPYWP